MKYLKEILLTLVGILLIRVFLVFVRFASAMEAAEKDFNDEGTGREARS